MADEDVIIEEQVEEPAAEQVEEPAEETTEEQVAAEESGEKESKTLLSGDEGDGDGEDASTGAPEEYEFTPPDGLEIDEERLEAFGEYAHGLGLSQDQFQKLIEYDIERTANAQQSMAEAYSERISSWADATKVDKELGGEQLDENLGLAKKAMESFASPELAKLIDTPSADNPDGLGLGNHPEVIRLFYRVGKAISESELVTGDSKIEGPDSLQRMYPSMYETAE
ncbi:MAG: hypothetical protein ACPHEP_07250, partial [Acidimicrobiales bacterium]